jgi:hypothetical protein
MTAPVDGLAQAFCARRGVVPPFETRRIRAGRNSEVTWLGNRGGQWILKRYYQHPSDTRNRLGTEFGFLQFLHAVGVRDVPRPLAADETLHLGLYAFLPGTRLPAVEPAHVSRAAAFILEVNRHRETPLAVALPLAADACLSVQGHLDLADARVRRLIAVAPESTLAAAVHRFVGQQLAPYWERLKADLTNQIVPTQLDRTLPFADRIISPSDFGFHNVLDDNGRLVFLDFEYAGWDDPAKLVCDFACQPEVPVSADQAWQFMEEVAAGLPHPEAVRERTRWLLPVHRVKWCCILLNEFRSEDRKRRSHAMGGDPDALMEVQFNKAQQYFDAHIAFAS